MLTKYFDPIRQELLVLVVRGEGGGAGAARGHKIKNNQNIKIKNNLSTKRSSQKNLSFVSIVCLFLVWSVTCDVTGRQFYDHFMHIM